MCQSQCVHNHTMQKLVGIVGLIGSGKGTAGDFLVENHSFVRTSFAHTLKDAVASIFGWPRAMLEGDTKESRSWREVPDPFWSNKMGRQITPRWVLQYFGTDVMRDHFAKDIWIWSMEKQILSVSDPVVITDVRFPNEIDLIQTLGGKLIWVRRNPEPEWLPIALNEKSKMPAVGVHESEWAWIGAHDYDVIWNDSDINTFYRQIESRVF